MCTPSAGKPSLQRNLRSSANLLRPSMAKVLACRLPTSGSMPDGVVPAMVPKFELEGGPPKGLPQQLVPHADAKHGLLAQQLLHVVHSVGHCRRVTLQQPSRS